LIAAAAAAQTPTFVTLTLSRNRQSEQIFVSCDGMQYPICGKDAIPS